MALIVQKFGGTSVGNVERIRNVAKRVARWKALGHDLIVVPLLLHISFLLLPAEVKETGWTKAGKHMVRLRIAFFVIILAILALLTGIFFAVKALLQHLS